MCLSLVLLPTHVSLQLPNPLVLLMYLPFSPSAPCACASAFVSDLLASLLRFFVSPVTGLFSLAFSSHNSATHFYFNDMHSFNRYFILFIFFI